MAIAILSLESAAGLTASRSAVPAASTYSWIGLRLIGGLRSSPKLSRNYTHGSRRQNSHLQIQAAKVETLTYVVQRKDTLWSIARQNDVTVEILKELNPGLETAIAVGQPLVVGTKKVEELKKTVAQPKVEAIKQAVAQPREAQIPPAARTAEASTPVVSSATAAASKASSSAPVTTPPRLTVGIATPPPPPLSSSRTFSPTIGFGMLTLGALAYFVTRKPSSTSVVNERLASTPVPSAPLPAPTPVPTAPQPVIVPEHAKTGTYNGSALPRHVVKRAAPGALATIAKYFPGAMEQESFIKACASELFNLGFSRDNCIALVNTCRDEVCRPLVSLIDTEFGHSFNMSGLGGLVNAGVTGLKAGMSHSPEFMCDASGVVRERYIFFAFPHISIGESGEPGSLLRRGRGRPSSACGALIAVQNSATSYADESDKPYPADDYEFVSLKRKVLAEPVCANCGPSGPSLIEVTKAALQVVTDDLEDLILKSANSDTADYAVITGVQIHSGNQIPGEPFRLERTVDYIAPGAMYAIIRGERYMMHTEVDQISDIRSLRPTPAMS